MSSQIEPPILRPRDYRACGLAVTGLAEDSSSAACFGSQTRCRFFLRLASGRIAAIPPSSADPSRTDRRFEARYGLALLKSGKRKKTLQERFDQLLQDDLENRVLLFDANAATQAAQLAAERKVRGRPIDMRDTFIAGIALARRGAPRWPPATLGTLQIYPSPWSIHGRLASETRVHHLHAARQRLRLPGRGRFQPKNRS